MESYDISRIDNILKYEFDHLFTPEARGLRGEQLIYEGRIKQGTVLSLEPLVSRFKEFGYDVKILGTEPGIILIFTLRGVQLYKSAVKEAKYNLHLLLFLVTFISTLAAGAVQFNVNILKEPFKIWMGLPFAFPLMMILMAHEMGHYILSLKHRIHATLPYFIPFPNIIGNHPKVQTVRN